MPAPRPTEQERHFTGRSGGGRHTVTAQRRRGLVRDSPINSVCRGGQAAVRYLLRRNTMNISLSTVSICVWILFTGLSCGSTSDWPFKESRYTVVVTQGTVITQHRPIIVVIRNAGDGEWMFFADQDPYLDTVVTLSLDEMIRIDKSIMEVADLPAGWKAVRSKAGEHWQRIKL